MFAHTPRRNSSPTSLFIPATIFVVFALASPAILIPRENHPLIAFCGTILGALTGIVILALGNIRFRNKAKEVTPAIPTSEHTTTINAVLPAINNLMAEMVTPNVLSGIYADDAGGEMEIVISIQVKRSKCVGCPANSILGIRTKGE